MFAIIAWKILSCSQNADAKCRKQDIDKTLYQYDYISKCEEGSWY